MKKKLIYICSPCRGNDGNYEHNIEMAQYYCRTVMHMFPNLLPIAPHVYFTQFLDDSDPCERRMGMVAGMELLEQCSEVWVFGMENPSAGMKKEIAKANELGIPIVDAAEALTIHSPAAASAFNNLIRGRTLLVAHNAQFDLLFSRALLHYTDIGTARLDACDYIDSLTVYKDRAAYPHKLANAIEHYSLEGKVKNSHRAIDDVLALYCVTYAMAEERMDLEQYVNIFGYNNRYGIMEPKLEKVTYHAQSYNSYITDDRTTLPAIIRTENGEGDQLTLDAFYEKEAAGHGTEPGL